MPGGRSGTFLQVKTKILCHQGQLCLVRWDSDPGLGVKKKKVKKNNYKS